MKNMLKKIYEILDKKQRVQVYILLVLILGGAFMETIGVSAILPLVSAVTDPTVIDSNKYFSYFKNLLNISDYKTFILLLAIGLIVVYIVKNIYLIFLNVMQNRFTNNNMWRMSVRLMKCYIEQDYLYHSEHNVADLERNVNRDINSFFYVINNLLMLFTELMVCMMLATFLLITDFSTTFVLIVIMIGFLLFFVKIVKKKLRYYGEHSRVSEAEKK